MKPITVIILALAMAATPSVSFDARTDRVRLESRWRDREIVIDGSDAEWPGPLLQIDQKTPVAIATANDGPFLYLVLTASEGGAAVAEGAGVVEAAAAWAAAAALDRIAPVP